MVGRVVRVAMVGTTTAETTLETVAPADRVVMVAKGVLEESIPTRPAIPTLGVKVVTGDQAAMEATVETTMEVTTPATAALEDLVETAGMEEEFAMG